MWPEGQLWKPGPAYPATVAAWPPAPLFRIRIFCSRGSLTPVAAPNVFLASDQPRKSGFGAEVRGTQPMRRSFRTRGCLCGWIPGLAPWAGMRCPYRAWIGNGVGSPVTETPSASRIGNTVGAPYRKHHRLCVRMGLFAEVAGSQQLVTRLVAPSSCIQPVTIRGRVQVIRPQQGGRGF